MLAYGKKKNRIELMYEIIDKQYLKTEKQLYYNRETRRVKEIKVIKK